MSVFNHVEKVLTQKSCLHARNAQHSVHPTGGSRRVFKPFAWLEVGSGKMALSCPAHPRVTQAVGQVVINLSIKSLKSLQQTIMKIKTTSPKLFIVIASTILLVAVVVFAGRFFTSSNSRDNQDPAKQKEMMAIVLEWGRLSPFPASATNVSVETEGNSFTRSFRARFVAPKQDIQSWIKDSPGLNEAVPEELSNNKVKYIITSEGGTNKAEVTIDYILNQVEIYVSWG
jgi:hypothetical protein